MTSCMYRRPKSNDMQFCAVLRLPPFTAVKVVHLCCAILKFFSTKCNCLWLFLKMVRRFLLFTAGFTSLRTSTENEHCETRIQDYAASRDSKSRLPAAFTEAPSRSSCLLLLLLVGILPTFLLCCGI